MNPSPSSASGPEDPAPAPEQPPAGPGPASTGTPGRPGVHNGFYAWLRSLGVVRAPDRWFGGVAGGVAARTGLDPVLIRGLFVVLGVFGVGFLAYGVAWALLPEPDGRIHVEEAVRGNWTSGMTGALVFTVLGTGGPGASVLGGDSWFGAVTWTLFWIGTGIAALYWFSGEKGRAYVQSHLSGGHSTSSAAGPSGSNPASTGQAPAGHTVSLAKSGIPTPDSTFGVPSPEPVPGTATGPLPPVPGAAPAEAPAPARGPHGNKAARTPGASGPYVACLFGAALLAAGAILALDYVNVLALGSPVSVALAAAAAVFGIGVVILGLAGRHSGGIGSAAVAALVAALLTQGSWANANLVVGSNADWAPADSAQAVGGYTSLAANGTVDLRETDLTGDTEIPVSVAAGNLNVLVPEDSPVTVRFGMAAGNVEVSNGTDRHDYSGLWQPTSERSINDGADGDRITIDVRGLAGNVLVTTEESDL